GEDIEKLKLNTALSAMMIFVNTAEKEASISASAYQSLLKLMAPFAPHLAEELWFSFGNTESIHLSEWPEYDEDYCVDDTITIAIQINGKVRAELHLEREASEEEIKEQALALPSVQKWIDGGEVKKVIYIKGKV